MSAPRNVGMEITGAKDSEEQKIIDVKNSEGQKITNIRELAKKIKEEELARTLPFSLVEKRDEENLKIFAGLQPKPNLNIRDEDGCLLLIKAVKNSTSDILGILLDAKADVTLKDKDGMDALSHAVQHNHVDMVNKLLEAKADVGTKNKNGRTPLHLAAIQNNPITAEALIGAKADIYAKDDQWGRTPYTLGFIYNYFSIEGHRGLVHMAKIFSREQLKPLGDSKPSSASSEGASLLRQRMGK
jgi:hypothetical protein